jgi:hypothetical protein
MLEENSVVDDITYPVDFMVLEHPLLMLLQVG